MMEPAVKLMYCVAVISLASAFALETDRPIVEVREGKLQGIREESFIAFRGIPYAVPPIGNLRFKDSEPVESWSGIRAAKDFGESCVQFVRSSKKISGSEDCLFLNIYTTNLAPKEPRAVMVWIHGGAFIDGSGNDENFGPDYLVQEDIVLVTVNYRLAFFGFLNLDDESAPGNQGLKDQVVALKWIQNNIAQFGGDPSNVTIFGESAGSSCVHQLTLSPLAQGLFQKAIMQSSVASNPWTYVFYPLRDAAENIAGKLGRTDEDLIDFLRNADAYKLLEAVHSFEFRKEGYFIENPFVTSVDLKAKKPFLNIIITEAVKAGIKVPHIIGHNGKEAIILKSNLTEEDYEQINKHQEPLLQPHSKKFLEARNISVEDVKDFFFGDKEISLANAQNYIDLVSADRYLINIHDVLKIQSSVQGIPSYFYRFDYYSKEFAVVQKILGTDLEGTAHTEENYYLFKSKSIEEQGINQPSSYPTGKKIQQRFLDLWTTFAKTGDPNSAEIGIVWKPVNDSIKYNCLEISENVKLIKETNLVYQLTQKKVIR